MKSEEQDEWCMSSGAKLIPKTKDEDGATKHVVLLLNSVGSDCVAPSPSHVVVIPGERLHADRPKRHAKRPRRRPSLPAATRPTVWIVQVSAILVTLAMALELHMEGDMGAGKNNSTDAFSGVVIPSIYKFTTKFTIPGNSPEAAKSIAKKQLRVASNDAAAPASIRSDARRPPMHQRLTLPYLGKSPDNATSEYNLSTIAAKAKGSSSTWYGLSVKEGRDPNPGLTRKTG